MKRPGLVLHAQAPVMIDDLTLADLTDAVSRGRLTLSELAVIRPDELSALFELACERLDTQRNSDAAALLACLVALFPYDARFWRAYGIALHRELALDAARAAYDAALVLAPGDDTARCYRGEIALYQGDIAGARHDLERVVKNG
ncbi:MAG: tetratricopeptide repeat protein, partial [Myxococcota bacterium]